ncbi:tRNA (adenine(22)-N(1))-methyltransferase, partial [Pediococcus acidilactici]
ICGMGGGLIADILADGVDKLASVERLILQPNNREDELRSWLMANHFKIIAEKIITENDKFYEIMVVEHGEMTLSDTELRFGPFLN